MNTVCKPAKKLRKYRRNVLFESVGDVAARAGVTASMIYQIELGDKRPGPRSYPKIARGYKLSIEQLQEMYGFI
jgi:transcriptional regulator with XRE-family HTH domain